MTMMLVTHEMAFARKVADHVIFMHRGKVWEEGPGEMLDAPQTEELRQFLGTELRPAEAAAVVHHTIRRLSMIRRSTLLKAALAFTAVAAMASAHADLLDDIKAAKKIRVAIDLGAPPYGMTDGQMKPTGSDVETARLLAKDLGVELEIVQTTGANRIPFLQTGKADIVDLVAVGHARAREGHRLLGALRADPVGGGRRRRPQPSRASPTWPASASPPRAAPPTTSWRPRAPRARRSSASTTTPRSSPPSPAARWRSQPPRRR